MGVKQEYDFRVRRLIPASVAGFAAALLFCLSLSVAPAQAQIHGVPTSVTSTGFGGHFDRVPGIPTSVTSLGPRGFNDPSHTFTGLAFQPSPLQPRPVHVHPGQPSHHHHRDGLAMGEVYAVPYFLPAYVDDSGDDGAADVSEPAAPNGPTIFDRRASGQSSQAVEANYAEQMLSEEQAQRSRQREALPRPNDSAAAATSDAPAAPQPNQPATVLVFKDGHQLEVQNYAIVGNTLYDLSAGHRTRIALTDLDLASTAKQNDDHGIDFQLPIRSETN